MYQLNYNLEVENIQGDLIWDINLFGHKKLTRFLQNYYVDIFFITKIIFNSLLRIFSVT